MGTSISIFYDHGSTLYDLNQRYLLTVGDIDKARQALVRLRTFLFNGIII